MDGLIWAAGGLGFLVIVVLLYGLAQRRRGRAEALKDRAENAVEQAREANEIDEDVDALPRDELYDELHGRK